jgi:hypothetical protein
MDIIAAHQHGLIEQLDDEVSALAGRATDHAQRAMVLHHLHDHARGAHVWAMAEARQALRIAAGIASLERRIERWGWVLGGREPAQAALQLLAEAFGATTRARTATAYRAYRVSATAALRSEAELSLPPALLEALDQCHAARRARTDLPEEAQRALAEESRRLADEAADPAALGLAWHAVDSTGLRRAARRLLGDKALAREAARDEKRGWARVERELRNDPRLPAAFRANPAQHFYALQHALHERRRQQWREACDREADAVELAA